MTLHRQEERPNGLSVPTLHVHSTLALRTPHCYGHMPLQTVWIPATRGLTGDGSRFTDSRYYGHYSKQSPKGFCYKESWLYSLNNYTRSNSPAPLDGMLVHRNVFRWFCSGLETPSQAPKKLKFVTTSQTWSEDDVFFLPQYDTLPLIHVEDIIFKCGHLSFYYIFFWTLFLELRNINSTLTTKDAKDRLTELTKQVFRSMVVNVTSV